MLTCLLLLISTIAQASAGQTAQIRVGLIIPETRQDRVTANPWGVQQRRGFELALKDAKNVRWEVLDNSESALVARENAQTFVRKGVDLVAGLSFSDQALAAKDILKPAGIPFISVFATAESLFDTERMAFSMAPPNGTQAAAIAAYLKSAPGVRNTGIGLIVARNCEYCVDFERELKKLLGASGIVIKQFPDILKNRPLPHDYFKDRTLEPYLAVLAYEVEGLSILNALAKQGFKGNVVGGDTWSTQTLQVGGNLGLLNQICLVNPAPYDVASKARPNQAFVRMFNQRYGEAPTDVAALAYDAGTAISRVATRCATSAYRSKCVVRTISELKFEGVSGRVAFSQRGTRIGGGTVLKSAACARMERVYGKR